MGSFKKAIFRVLCLCCVFIGGGGVNGRPNPEELVDLGLESIRLGNVSGKVEDFIRDRKYIEKACELNDGRGCYWLGEFHESGGGTVKKDLKKAIQYYVKACGLNNGWGCNNLGDLYQNGQGVEKT
ncbi:tetratricopeptide repeat protein [Helicobacter pylori]|uniref:tetratricopeptide repeat protein n=1 Tax=Helicobacter pylori TaxID=210 RepID=UPI0029278A31|nr:tetratricopeptide repeat protein [Helicobacter pylori]MDU9792404.1 tetratricopeptide repeat protein [Helicobacter pylori]